MLQFPGFIVQHILSFLDHHPAITHLEAPAEYRKQLEFWLQYYPELVYEYYAASFFCIEEVYNGFYDAACFFCSKRAELSNSCYHCAGDFKMIHPLFTYLAGNSDLVIAGGFATQVYLGCVPKVSSDIDIFILNDREIQPLLSFLARLGTTHVEVNDYSRFVDSCVVQMKVPKLNYMVQLVCTDATSVTEVLNSFDSSHCKCFIFKGKTYAAPDARFSLKSKQAVAYKSMRLCRVRKALKYVDSFINLNVNVDLSETCCTKLKTTEIPIEQVRMKRGHLTNYSGTHHFYLLKRELERRVDLQSDEPPNFKRSFLEKMGRLHIIPTFKLTCANDSKEFLQVHTTHFRTSDDRVNDVYKFWVSIAGALDIIEDNALKKKIWPRRPLQRIRKPFSPKEIIKPLGFCDNRLLVSLGYHTTCEGHRPWTRLVLPEPYDFETCEYEFQITFTKTSVKLIAEKSRLFN